jgi:hypothetical protein
MENAMYLQCKHGFIEADCWDGKDIPVLRGQEALCKKHRIALSHAAAFADGDGGVMVVRSRDSATIQGLGIEPGAVLESPKGWDYPYRVYLTKQQFKVLLSLVVDDCDYRNFKSWCHVNKPEDSALAHDIWKVAYDAGQKEHWRNNS